VSILRKYREQLKIASKGHQKFWRISTEFIENGKSGKNLKDFETCSEIGEILRKGNALLALGDGRPYIGLESLHVHQGGGNVFSACIL